MNFADVVSDIEKLKHKKLQSIRRGAEITIEQVDAGNDRVFLTTHKGERKSRPLTEIRILWERLCSNAAVHVDSALGGSGSSRNQPETILANLPYVEWLTYKNKKHIALVGTKTHDLGTIKEMDGLDAEETKKKLKEGIETTLLATIVVIATDVRQATESLENATGLKVESLESGLYKKDHSGARVFIVSKSSVPAEVPSGTYVVIRGTSIPEHRPAIRVGSQTLYPVLDGGMNIMILEREVSSTSYGSP